LYRRAIYFFTPKVSPFTIPALLGNTASGVVAIETGAKGPNYRCKLGNLSKKTKLFDKRWFKIKVSS
jgi:hypothetical protein